jgi:3-hydroxyacyl-CoA dehydrogenase/3a,7a,12a-trihydroxy-5b-cholest-24-enoyl-CoA hydratase
MSELKYDGKVVVVTGAGNGLGRTHALAFARRGAKVVINDLGGSHTGEGKSSSAADKVVEEIKAFGGEAVANYDSVEFGDKIIQTAMDTFGRVDVLINNAGILRDVSFAKMTDADWNLIDKVHVYGAYKCCHAAWPIMRDQKFGRIILTASAAGIYGNFGQANYAMAKLGLFGLGQTLAIEGRKNNVFVNTIAPVAGSRMTETVLPQDLLDALKPEYVTELVAWLAHESCQETGGLFEVGGGFYGKLRFERTKGKTFRLGRPVSAEDIQGAWKDVTSFEDATHPANIQAALEPIMDNVKAGVSRGGNKFIDVDAALGYEYPTTTLKYDERDLSLYALGIGAAEDPLNESDLRYVNEIHGEGFIGFPTFGVVPPIKAIFDLGKQGKTAPGFNFGLDRVLHGEQYLEVKKPIPEKGKLTQRSKVIAIYDKGSDGGRKGGAVVVTEFEAVDESGDVLFKNEVTTFVRGAGGWGGDRGPDEKNLNASPDRAPDATIEQRIHPNQALLYRLSGDWNPLHADPGFAKAFGFEKPILHGLCTFGYAARHVVQTYAPKGDARFFKSIKVRFADPVLPGETIITEMWKESDTKILFRVKSKDRDKVVISNAAVELYSEIPKAKAKPAASASTGAVATGPNSADIFAGIAAFFAKTPGTGDKVKTVFQFQLSNPSSVWTLDLSSGNGSVASGETAAPGCTLAITEADFLDMCTGKADAMKLFTGGKLKITGNVMASQKLDFLKKVDPADVTAAMQKRAGGGAASAPAAAPTSSEPTSADIFAGIGKFLQKTPGTGDKVKTVYVFQLSNPSSVWTINLASGDGSVSAGAAADAGCTLEISDADFMTMFIDSPNGEGARGKADAMKLFTGGKLKISGNIMASQKLDFLKKVDPADVLAAAKARTGGAAPAPTESKKDLFGNAAAPAAAAAPSGAASAPGLIEKLRGKLAANAQLAGEVGARIELRVKGPDATFDINLKGANAITEGKSESPDITLTLSDADFAKLSAGGSLHDMYQRGQMRVDGDAHLVKKLGFLTSIAT